MRVFVRVVLVGGFVPSGGNHLRAGARAVHEGDPRGEVEERQDRLGEDRSAVAGRDVAAGVCLSAGDAGDSRFAQAADVAGAAAGSGDRARDTFTQYNLAPLEKRLRNASNRVGVAERFADESVQRAVASDLQLAEHLDEQLRGIELYLTQHAKIDDPQTFARLQTVPGIGPILALVFLYETHHIQRFETVQQFVSYCRLVKCSHESAGKKMTGHGNKIGNAHLKWAFSEAALLMLREREDARHYVAKLEKKHGKAKAISILAARIGRTVYWMLKRKESFDETRFLK